MSTNSFVSNARRATGAILLVAALGLCARGLDSVLASIRTIRSRANPSRRTRRRRPYFMGSRPKCRILFVNRLQTVVRVRKYPTASMKWRTELVHESDWDRPALPSRSSGKAQSRSPPDPSRWTLTREKGQATWLHGEDAKARPVSRIRLYFLKGRPAVAVATKSSGRHATRVESFLTTF
jgi:hypothetical protein